MSRRFLVGLLVVVSVSATRLVAQLPTTPFHPDEANWITASMYYTRLVVSGNLDAVAWRGDHLRAWGALNPQLGKWLIGVPLTVHEHRTGRRFDGWYDFNRTLEE